MADVTVDASAIIALVKGEPGSDVVEAQLHGAAISTVNIAEVGDFLSRRGGTRQAIEAAIRRLPLRVVEPDFDLALDASMLLPLTRAAGLSVGDRFCLALAKRLGHPALTADRAWMEIADETGVEVRLIR